MSAAAARRRKQRLQKEKKLSSQENLDGGEDECDAVILRLDDLLTESEGHADKAEAEGIAYEALQLAQSQVRRCVKHDDGARALRIASGVVIHLLRDGYVAMASQLSMQMMDALVETRAGPTEERTARLIEMDGAYRGALGRRTADGSEEEEIERERLQRLHLQFLRKVVKWSDDLGPIRYGDPALHGLLADCAWDVPGETADAVLHYALAEQPAKIAELLFTLPPKEDPDDYTTPAAERDALLTRAVLVMIAVENLRDANALVADFVARDTDRDAGKMAKLYAAKGPERRQTHVTFCSALLRICETEAAPLYSWLLRSFSKELNLYPDLQPYTSKIGRVYFGIQPPPSMLNMMENMMGMMGAGGMGAMEAMAGGGGGF